MFSCHWGEIPADLLCLPSNLSCHGGSQETTVTGEKMVEAFCTEVWVIKIVCFTDSDSLISLLIPLKKNFKKFKNDPNPSKWFPIKKIEKIILKCWITNEIAGWTWSLVNLLGYSYSSLTHTCLIKCNSKEVSFIGLLCWVSHCRYW